MQSREPSRVAAAVAAALPVVSAMAAMVVLLLAAGSTRTLLRMMREAGGPALLVFVFFTLGTIGSAVLLGLAGLGRRVPSAVVVVVAALPWLAGALGTMVSLTRVEEALDFAASDQRAALMVVGVGEALNARFFGSLFGGALLAAAGIGLGLASFGQRAPGRSTLRGSVLGAATALLLPVAAAVVVALGALGTASILVVLPALGAVVALGLAGAGAGADEPHGRSAALAAAAPVPAGLALAAGAVAAGSLGTIRVFQVIGAVNPSDFGRIVVQAATEIAPASVLERVSALVAAIPAAALVLWSLSRSRPDAGRLVGAVALLLAAAAIVGLDRGSTLAASHSLARASRPPWDDEPGFEPLPLGGPAEGEPDLLVTRAHAIVDGGPPIAAATLATPAGQEALRSPLQRAMTVRRLEGERGEGERGEDLPSSPMVSVAFDRRVPAATLRAVLQAAQDAGARSVQLVGIAAHPDEAFAGDGGDPALGGVPLLAQLRRPPGARVVLLAGALDPQRAAADRFLLHGPVVATGPLVLQRRAGSGPPLRLEPHREGAPIDEGLGGAEGDAAGFAMLALGPAATAAAFARAVELVSEADLQPVAILGDSFPGHPEAAAAP